MAKNHPLHLKVAKVVEQIVGKPGSIRVIADKACGGNQKIPLFCTDDKLRETCICNPDLMLIVNGKIRVVIEIEESDITPVRVCGKLMVSALSRCYIHKTADDVPIGFDKRVLFIQVLDESKLPKGSVKSEQSKLIEENIQKILPLRKHNISDYKLIWGNSKKQNLHVEMKRALKPFLS